MKTLSVITDIVESKPFAVAVIDGGLVSAYGLTDRGRSWADHIMSMRATSDELPETLGPTFTMGKTFVLSNATLLRLSDTVGKDVVDQLRTLMQEPAKPSPVSEKTFVRRVHSCYSTPISEYGEDRQTIISYKAAAFSYEKQRAATEELLRHGTEIKSVRAIFDPNLGPSGGFRCPEGTANGGMITNRFGRGCGGSIIRRIGRSFEDLGRSIVPDAKPGRRTGRGSGGVDVPGDGRGRPNLSPERMARSAIGSTPTVKPITARAGRAAAAANVSDGKGKRKKVGKNRRSIRRRLQEAFDRLDQSILYGDDGDNNRQTAAPTPTPKPPKAPKPPKPPKAPKAPKGTGKPPKSLRQALKNFKAVGRSGYPPSNKNAPKQRPLSWAPPTTTSIIGQKYDLKGILSSDYSKLKARFRDRLALSPNSKVRAASIEAYIDNLPNKTRAEKIFRNSVIADYERLKILQEFYASSFIAESPDGFYIDHDFSLLDRYRPLDEAAWDRRYRLDIDLNDPVNQGWQLGPNPDHSYNPAPAPAPAPAPTPAPAPAPAPTPAPAPAPAPTPAPAPAPAPTPAPTPAPAPAPTPAPTPSPAPQPAPTPTPTAAPAPAPDQYANDPRFQLVPVPDAIQSPGFTATLPPIVGSKPAWTGQLTSSNRNTINTNLRTYKRWIEIADSTQQLQQEFRSLQRTINSLIDLRDNALASWRSTTNNPALKRKFGSQARAFNEELEAIFSQIIDADLYEKKFQQLANAERNIAIAHNNRVQSLLNALRSGKALSSPPLPDNQLQTTDATRPIQAISDLVDSNYSNGHAIIGGDPGILQVDDQLISILAQAQEIFNKHGDGRQRWFTDENGIRHFDELYHHLLLSQGFSRKSVKVTEEEFRTLADNGWMIIHRGTGGESAGGAPAWIDGVYYAGGNGARAYGLGTYFSLKPEPSYYGARGDKSGIAMVISPNAKIVQSSVLDRMRQDGTTKINRINQLVDRFEQGETGITAQQIKEIAGDNPLAALVGQLAIKRLSATDQNEIDSLNLARSQASHLGEGWDALVLGYDGIIHSNGFVTLLNRSAGAVLETPLTEDEARQLPTGTRGSMIVSEYPSYVWPIEAAPSAPDLPGGAAPQGAQSGRVVKLDFDPGSPFTSNITNTDSAFKTSDGKYVPQRAGLHRRMIDAIKGTVSPSYRRPAGQRKTMWVMGGAPGTGKSTLRDEGFAGIPDMTQSIYVDPDAIKEMLPEYRSWTANGRSDASSLVHGESKDIASQALREALETDNDVVYDTTGVFVNGFGGLRAARNAGYKIVANYTTTDLATARARLDQRAQDTGRNVPGYIASNITSMVPGVVNRIISEGLVDDFYLWDTTSTGERVLVARKLEGGTLEILDQTLWNRFRNGG